MPLSARFSYEYGWEASPSDVELDRDGNPHGVGVRRPLGRLVSVTNHQLAPIAPDLGATQVGGPGGNHTDLPAVALSPSDHQSLVLPVPSDEDADAFVRHAVPPRLLSWMRSRARSGSPSPAPPMARVARARRRWGSGHRPRSRRCRRRLPRAPPDARLSTRRRTPRRRPTPRSWLRSARRRPRRRRSLQGCGRCGPDVAVQRGGRREQLRRSAPERESCPSSRPSRRADPTTRRPRPRRARSPSTRPAAAHRERAETRPRSNRSDSRPIATTARPVNTPKCQIHLLGANARREARSRPRRTEGAPGDPASFPTRRARWPPI